VGVLSRHALHGLQRENGVQVISVRGFPLPAAWHVVHHVDQKLTPVANAFMVHLHSALDMSTSKELH
jgi:hypothetical protein